MAGGIFFSPVYFSQIENYKKIKSKLQHLLLFHVKWGISFSGEISGLQGRRNPLFDQSGVNLLLMSVMPRLRLD